MEFKAIHDVETRLSGNDAPLTVDEIQAMRLYLKNISGGGLRRIYAELALQNLAAIQRFDDSSSELTKRLLCLTYVIVGFTVITAITAAITAVPLVQSWFR